MAGNRIVKVQGYNNVKDNKSIVAWPVENGMKVAFDTGCRIDVVELQGVKEIGELNVQWAKDKLTLMREEIELDEIVLNCITSGGHSVISKIKPDATIIIMNGESLMTDELPYISDFYSYEYYILQSVNPILFSKLDLYGTKKNN